MALPIGGTTSPLFVGLLAGAASLYWSWTMWVLALGLTRGGPAAVPVGLLMGLGIPAAVSVLIWVAPGDIGLRRAAIRGLVWPAVVVSALAILLIYWNGTSADRLAI